MALQTSHLDLQPLHEFIDGHKQSVASTLLENKRETLSTQVSNLPKNAEEVFRAAESDLPIASTALALASIARVIAHVANEKWTDALHVADIALILLGLPLARCLPAVIASLNARVQRRATPEATLCAEREISLQVPQRLRRACPRLEKDAVNLQSFREFFRADKPVLLEAYAAQWPAVRKWQKTTFWDAFAPRTVPVEYVRADDAQMVEQFWRIEDVMQLMRTDVTSRGGRCVYLAQHPLMEYISELKRDVPFPHVTRVAKGARLASNIWMGCAGSGTKLHYDSADNILVQIVGCKTVVLIEQDMSERLYVDPMRRNLSRVDLLRADHEQFPLFAQVEGMVVDLEPGDALYIPAQCWHWVKATSPSISVNFWF